MAGASFAVFVACATRPQSATVQCSTVRGLVWSNWLSNSFVQCCGIMPKAVLQNTDTEVEFIGVFRPPKRSTKETIKLCLYNSEAGTVLGRTGRSWGKDVLWLL